MSFILLIFVSTIFIISEKDYPEIKHSFDIWHGSKNLGKKIIKVRQSSFTNLRIVQVIMMILRKLKLIN